jgi:undecaprenyl-diphosphatase
VSYLEAFTLGVLQGVTEFLPVSSSGHLALLEHIVRLPEAQRLPLSAVLHIGTLGAVLVFFARRLGGIMSDCIAQTPERRRAGWRLVGFVALGSAPAAAAGLLFEERIEAVFSSPILVAVMLLVTGAFLFGTRLVRQNQARIGWGRAVLVGLAQAVAILPGISRSGATIAAGIYAGLAREQAFEFSLLLSIPAVFGATLLELRRIDLGRVSAAAVGLGTLMAFASGLGALVLLRRAVTGRRLYLFAYYLWVVGLAALVFVR